MFIESGLTVSTVSLNTADIPSISWELVSFSWFLEKCGFSLLY